MRASSYVTLPKQINTKKATLNIQNKDNKCFAWSVLAKIHHVDRKNHPERVNNYRQYEQELDMNGIDCPVKITDIAKFERQNTSIIVNVFGLDDTKIFPLRITTVKDAPHHVNLLYVAKDEKSHYILVRDLNRLAGKQLNKHCSKKFLCNYCLHGC